MFLPTIAVLNAALCRPVLPGGVLAFVAFLVWLRGQVLGLVDECQGHLDGVVKQAAAGKCGETLAECAPAVRGGWCLPTIWGRRDCARSLSIGTMQQPIASDARHGLGR